MDQRLVLGSPAGAAGKPPDERGWFGTSKQEDDMRIGASLLLIAIGAILRFAVTKHFSGLDVQTVGVILLLIGIAGLLFDLTIWGTRRRTTVLRTGGTPYVSPATPYVDPRLPSRTTYVEPNDPANLI
jgi:hypothetical protein